MKQKAYISMIALLLTLLSFSGCARSGTSESADTQPAAPLPAEPSPAQTEEQQQAPGFPENIREELETVPDSCMAVLLGEGAFLAETGESLMIDQVSKAVSANPDITFAASEFAVVDLDYDDRAAEIVLRIIHDDSESGSLILHDRDGTAYSYYLGIRAFNDLRQEGTFFFSDGGSSGVGTITFTEEGYIRNDIAITSGCGGIGARADEVWWYELSEERLAALRELK